MTDIDLSLDDIIKKKNFKNNSNSIKTGFQNKKGGLPIKRLNDGLKSQVQKNNVVDARLKLQRNRRVGDGAPIVDARYRLEALRSRNRGRNIPKSRMGIARRGIQARLGFGVPMDMDVEVFDYGHIPRSAGPLLRTVENDLSLFRGPFDWDRPVEDEFDLERLRRSERMRPSFLPDARDLEGMSVTVASNPHTVGILKRPSDGLRPPFRLEDQDLDGISMTVINKPSVPRSRHMDPISATTRALSRPVSAPVSLSERFHRSVDRNAEAALKIQALKLQLQASQTEESPNVGHVIAVSNLVPFVTDEDVKELFGDIGELISSRVIRPGIAEVVYRNYEDAVKAVDVYHNRQLDGQPMKCLLVKSNQPYPKRKMGLNLDNLRNALHRSSAS